MSTILRMTSVPSDLQDDRGDDHLLAERIAHERAQVVRD